jgi:signal transduction histidine kinase
MTDLPFATFVQNAALLLAVAVVFDAATDWGTGADAYRGRFVTCALLGVIGISIMLTPFQFAPGLFFDSRGVLLSVAGLFFGAFPATIAAAMMASFRIAQGGDGVGSAIAVIAASVLIGLVWRRPHVATLASQSTFDLWRFGLVAHVVILATVGVGVALTVSATTAINALSVITLPVLVVPPVATALLGSLLVNRLRARGLAEANARLQARVAAQLEEVRASRARIVAATDAERKRVERDLHDGAQQRLVAVTLSLRLARTQLETGAVDDAAATLAETTEESKAALSELRELARGIHPQILTESGLRPAIESLAKRAPVPVDLEVDVARASPVVESTAYFVVSEALANVAKYSAATHALVRVRDPGDRIEVEVVDDGIGGADPAAGSGLRGLADRLAAINGTLDVHSLPGQGTRIVAHIPREASDYGG